MTQHCTGPRGRGRIPRVNSMSYIFSTNCMPSTGQGNRHVSVLEDPRVLGGGRPRNRSSVEGPERTGCQEAVGPQTRGTWPRKGLRKSPGEVTAELTLEGVQKKQEGIPGRGGSLSKKGRKKKRCVHWQGLPRSCRQMQNR